MQYMGGKSRIARYIAEIINNTLNGGAFNEMPRRQEPYSNTFGADPQRYGGGLALLAFSVVAAPLKAKLPAMTELY